MTELTILSPRDYPIKSLIESALDNEVRLLEAGMRQTQHRLRQFEATYALATEAFIARYANNEIDETLETIEWLGEHRMALRIREKIDTLKELHFAN